MSWLAWLIAFVAGAALATVVHRMMWSLDRKELEQYQRRLLKRSGWTSFRGIGAYSLVSFDGGVNWHLANEGHYRNGTYYLRVLGSAEKECLGLVEHDRALWELFELVKLGRTVPWDEFCRRAAELLGDAGFYFEPEAVRDSPNVFQALVPFISECPITCSEGRFRRVVEVLEAGGFSFYEDVLVEKALRSYVEDDGRWPKVTSAPPKKSGRLVL